MADLVAWAKYGPADDFWPLVIISIILSLFGFIAAFYFFRRKRIIEDTPTSKIRSAAQGYAEISGYGDLLDGPPIIAPLTGRICTWYSYKIEQRRKTRKRTVWITIEQGTSEELFLLLDDTGQCVVDPDGARVTPAVTNVWYGHTSWPHKDNVSDGTSKFSVGFGKYRYTEKRMHPEDHLYAIGLFKTVGGADGNFNINTDVRTLLKEWKQDSESLLSKFDKDKNGEIDIHEWEAVREAALNQAIARQKELKTVPPVNMMTNTHDRRRPYILSALPQAQLIKRFYYYSIGMIILFFIAGTFASWMIKLRMTVL